MDTIRLLCSPDFHLFIVVILFNVLCHFTEAGPRVLLEILPVSVSVLCCPQEVILYLSCIIF